MQSVKTFFYGGLMNPAVMTRLGMEPSPRARAVLPGYRIRIAPWVTLDPDPLASAFGVLMEIPHAALDSIYRRLAVDYHPYPVIVHAEPGPVAALTYLAGPMQSDTATQDHVAPLLESALELEFPDWYVAEIRAFLPV